METDPSPQIGNRYCWTTDIWEKQNMYKDVFPDFLLWRRSIWNADFFPFKVLVLPLGMCIFCLKFHRTQNLDLLAHLDQGRRETPAERVQHVLVFPARAERSCLFFHVCHVPAHLPRRSPVGAAFKLTALWAGTTRGCFVVAGIWEVKAQ